MEMILIKRDSQEWNNMWDNLAIHPINEGIEEPSVALNESEGWQYMGSFRQDNRIIHEFRHRNHPKFQRREYVKFFASDTINDDDIEKVVQIK
jgi:hypothetical protein